MVVSVYLSHQRFDVGPDASGSASASASVAADAAEDVGSGQLHILHSLGASGSVVQWFSGS